jgi:four helix bundle protein
MTSEELRKRTMRFAVRVVRFCRTLPDTWEARRIGGQLIDAGTSVAMNYRGATRGRSRAEFIAKLGIVVEEADESVGWLELIGQVDLARGPEFDWLLGEANELVAIFGKSQKTAKENSRRVLTANHLINRISPNRRSSINEAPP